MDFQQAGEQFKQLKHQFDSGRLAEADFKTRLRELMVQDEQGCWWMIGRETGEWYRHDGTDWVRADPPVARPEPMKPPGEPERGGPVQAAAAIASPRAEVPAGSIHVRPGWLTVLWITLAWTIGVGAVILLLPILGSARDHWQSKAVAQFIWWADLGDGVFPVFASMLILGGLAGLMTALALRSQGVISGWKAVWSIALGWAICMALIARTEEMLPWAGAAGGLAMALILHFTGALRDWAELLWITPSWALPWLPAVFYPDGPMSASMSRLLAGAAIAAFILVWRLRQENKRMSAKLGAAPLSI